MICKSCDVDWYEYDEMDPRCPMCGGKLVDNRCCGRTEPCKSIGGENEMFPERKTKVPCPKCGKIITRLFLDKDGVLFCKKCDTHYKLREI